MAPVTVQRLIFAICAIAIVGQRIHTFSEPPERDIAIYAVIAHEMQGERRLYVDLVDQKPPGVYLTWALAEMIAGYGYGQIFLLGILSALLVLAGVWKAAVNLTDDPRAGPVAGIAWTLICSDMLLQANQPNTEALLNVCSVWALALWAKSSTAQTDWRRFLLIGGLFAIGSLYKQVIVVQAALLSLAALRWHDPERSRRPILIEIAVAAAVGLVTWVTVLACFHVQGSWDAFAALTFEYNRFYAGSMGGNLLRGLHPANIIRRETFFLIPLMILTGLGLYREFTKRRQQTALLAAAIIGAHLAVLLPGHLFRHYYQLWLPVLAIGAAVGFSSLSRDPANKRLKRGLAGLTLAVLLLNAGVNLSHPAATWSARKYNSEIFVHSAQMATVINDLLAPNESFYEFGAEPSMYMLTQKSPPTGIIHAWYTMPFWGGPLSERLAEQLLADLKKAPPDLIVADRVTMDRTPKGHVVLNWIVQNYVRFPGPPHPERFTLLARQGSGLHRRILSGRPAREPAP